MGSKNTAARAADGLMGPGPPLRFEGEALLKVRSGMLGSVPPGKGAQKPKGMSEGDREANRARIQLLKPTAKARFSTERLVRDA